MAAEIQAEGSLLVIGIMLLTGSISLYLVTGRPRMRFIILLDMCLLFWLVSYGINVLFYNPQTAGFWQMISLMGFVLLIFAFMAALSDYVKMRNDF